MYITTETDIEVSRNPSTERTLPQMERVTFLNRTLSLSYTYLAIACFTDYCGIFTLVCGVRTLEDSWAAFFTISAYSSLGIVRSI